MSGVRFPADYQLERLCKSHRRKAFASGHPLVDEWLAVGALQRQAKHLSATRVLLDEAGDVAGYDTLATGQVDFGDLPTDVAKHMPRRMLPVAVLAWLGVATGRQGQGLGRSLLAQALRDCYDAGQTFPFVAVILDCVDDKTQAFYQHFDFSALPGHPYRLFLGFRQLEAMMTGG